MTAGTRYWVVVNRPRSGLFASFLQVLGHLHHAKQEHLVPVVFFGSNWPYWSQGGVHGAHNAWEYYFAPVSGTPLRDLVHKSEEELETSNIFSFAADRIIPTVNAEHWYDLSRQGSIDVPANVTIVNNWPSWDAGTRFLREERRKVFHELITEYIRVQPWIAEKAERFYGDNLAGRPVIAVHFRGPDHNTEVVGWHRLAYAREYLYGREIDCFLDQHPDALVLCATDNEKSLAWFQNRYGGRLRYYPARRSTAHGSPHFEFGGAEVGEEMLIEGLLLARADHFVHGISNVAFAVACLNPKLAHVDVYQRNERWLHNAWRVRNVIRRARALW